MKFEQAVQEIVSLDGFSYKEKIDAIKELLKEGKDFGEVVKRIKDKGSKHYPFRDGLE